MSITIINKQNCPTITTDEMILSMTQISTKSFRVHRKGCYRLPPRNRGWVHLLDSSRAPRRRRITPHPVPRSPGGSSWAFSRLLPRSSRTPKHPWSSRLSSTPKVTPFSMPHRSKRQTGTALNEKDKFLSVNANP